MSGDFNIKVRRGKGFQALVSDLYITIRINEYNAKDLKTFHEEKSSNAVWNQVCRLSCPILLSPKYGENDDETAIPNYVIFQIYDEEKVKERTETLGWVMVPRSEWNPEFQWRDVMRAERPPRRFIGGSIEIAIEFIPSLKGPHKVPKDFQKLIQNPDLHIPVNDKHGNEILVPGIEEPFELKLPSSIVVVNGLRARCSIYLTKFRILIKLDIQESILSIWYQHISQVTKESNKMEMIVFDITCRDIRTIQVICPTPLSNRHFEFIQRVTYKALNWGHGSSGSETMTAVTLHQTVNKRLTAGWNIFSMEDEMERQGLVATGRFKLISENQSYGLCPSYTKSLYIPSDCGIQVMYGVANFRKQKRLPIVTWYNQKSDTIIIRSSQPAIGMWKERSSEDEMYLKMLMETSKRQDQLIIADCRTKAAAKANRFRGGGKESKSRYDNLKVFYFDIPNIHVVRKSFQDLSNAITDGELPESEFLGKVAKSKWLIHVRACLSAALSVVRWSEKGLPVLVHCSDGWDRTSQVVALAQIMLDPYFRTIEGFRVLIEKDWLAFGHKFKDRTGTPNDKNDHEQSPIFLQFLEGTRALMLEYPEAFEFTVEFIVFLADHHNSGLFGNFMCNNEAARCGISSKSISIWAVPVMRNRIYTPFNGTLSPILSYKSQGLFQEFFLRYDIDSNALRGWVGVNTVPDVEAIRRDINILKCENTGNEKVLWVPDNEVNECTSCQMQFSKSLFSLNQRRKHHCRQCGHVFCSRCTQNWDRRGRLCDECWSLPPKSNTDNDYLLDNHNRGRRRKNKSGPGNVSLPFNPRVKLTASDRTPSPQNNIPALPRVSSNVITSANRSIKPPPRPKQYSSPQARRARTPSPNLMKRNRAPSPNRQKNVSLPPVPSTLPPVPSTLPPAAPRNPINLIPDYSNNQTQRDFLSPTAANRRFGNR